MKKFAMVLAVAVLVAFAGAAYAGGGWGHGGWGHGGGMGWCGSGYGGGQGMMGGPGMMRGGGWGPGADGSGQRFHNDWRNTNVPQNIRDIHTKTQHLRVDLRDVMSQSKIDVSKARSLFKEIQANQNKLAEWRFEQMLKYRTENVPGAPAVK